MKSLIKVLILSGALFTVACNWNKENEVSLLSKNFNGEIDVEQNLTFSFNKNLCPDSLINTWDTTKYIAFTPSIPGKFRWDGSSELIFSPEHGFRPSTAYTGVLTDKLLKHTREKYYLTKKNTIQFHTPYLRVEGGLAQWTRPDATPDKLAVQLNLTFNYEINPAVTAKYIKVMNGSEQVDFSSPTSSGNSKILSLLIAPPTDKDESTTVNVQLLKGMKLPESDFITDKATTIPVIVPSRYNLSVTNLSAEHNGTEGIVSISTSQRVMETNLASHISIKPVVKFTVDMTSDGFSISSDDFNVDNTYEITIDDQVEGEFGGKLKEPYDEQFTFGKLEPSISFTNNRGLYLAGNGLKNVALNIVNVPNVKVTITKIYENNIEVFMRGSNYYYGSDDDVDSYDANYYNTTNYGDVLWTKDYSTKSLPRQNASRILHLDFEDKIRHYKGIYVVEVSSDSDEWVRKSKILAISDVGLIVKQERDGMMVFANSFKTAQPLEGVDISFISSNNQVLYTAKTNSSGVATFDNISKVSPGFQVSMITSRIGDDFNFVPMKRTTVETSRFDVGGKSANSTGLDAFIYGDRNLYRPNETINLTTVIRDLQWQQAGEIPVKLTLLAPNGKNFKTIKKILDKQGAFETSIKIPLDAMTGTYTAEVFTSNDVLLNTYEISVEEFLPDRIKVNLSTDKDEYHNNDSITCNATAVNLFGPPAADRNYQYELNLNRTWFDPKQYPDYIFYNDKAFSFATVYREGKTDQNGKITEGFRIPADLSDVGLLDGSILLTVFDETGRPVHKVVTFPVYTQDIFYGIKYLNDWVDAEHPVRIPLIAVDKNGVAKSNVKAQVDIVRKEWHTAIVNTGNGYQYQSQEDDITQSTQIITLDGTTTSYTFTPKQSGDYEVRVSRPGSGSYIKSEFYAWGWWYTEFTSFKVNNEGNVTIKADKEKYQAGDQANILFTTPFDGRLLVTIERNDVLNYYYLDTKEKSASLSINLPDDFVPNVYVSATLFRPMDGVSGMPLTVAHGIKPITVENKTNKLPVVITAVDHSRSKTKQTISVKATPGSQLTIAAVDEGILQIKNYQTPDPYGFFYQKQALGVNSYDVYPWLMPELSDKSSFGGGDMNLSKRTNPNPANRVNLVSFWSGILTADDNGNASFSIDIPQFSGDLRVMVAAYKNNAFGSAESHIKVSDPVVISTGLPRFLSPKDSVIMPITISNTTKNNANAVVSLQIDGPINVVGGTQQTISVNANSENHATFKLYTLPQTGKGTVTVSVKSMNETFTDKTEISIRPPASLQKVTGSGQLAGGQNQQFMYAGNYMPYTVDGKIIVSHSPLVQFSDNLDYLVGYPYGCVEQTTSTAFPQLYYSDMVKAIYGKDNKTVNPYYNVQAAINKLQGMQLYDGGLSYWPGGDYECWWGTVYASHFLLEAKKAGYEVDDAVLNRIYDYLVYKLKTRDEEKYWYNFNQWRYTAPEEAIYSLYVLALAGKPKISIMDYYKANPDLLTLDSKYMLAAAFALAGEKTKYLEALPAAFTGEQANRTFSGSFNSYIRDEALALNVLLEVDPQNPQVGIMAQHISKEMRDMRNSYYFNTQEESFAFLALGKIAHNAALSTATATITANGKTIGNLTDKDVIIDGRAYQGQQISITANGSGNLYYFWQASGITADGRYKEEDSYMKVRKSFYDRYGHPVSSLKFKQNDLVVVKISIITDYTTPIDNVVITDMLPACFEIENPRISDISELSWIKDNVTPDYSDYRDDRVNLFTSVGESEKDFYYVVRVVSPGVYKMGPVQADAMYDDEYHSYNGDGTIIVTQK